MVIPSLQSRRSFSWSWSDVKRKPARPQPGAHPHMVDQSGARVGLPAHPAHGRPIRRRSQATSVEMASSSAHEGVLPCGRRGWACIHQSLTRVASAAVLRTQATASTSCRSSFGFMVPACDLLALATSIAGCLSGQSKWPPGLYALALALPAKEITRTAARLPSRRDAFPQPRVLLPLRFGWQHRHPYSPPSPLRKTSRTPSSTRRCHQDERLRVRCVHRRRQRERRLRREPAQEGQGGFKAQGCGASYSNPSCSSQCKAALRRCESTPGAVCPGRARRPSVLQAAGR
jgi:hypothetical protein